MFEISFYFNDLITKIPCERNELINNICKKFSELNKIELKNYYFLYEGELVKNNITFNQLASKEDKATGKINIIVCKCNDRIGIQNNNNIKVNENIICPKFPEKCFISIKDYKMEFYRYKNNHKIFNLLFNDIILFKKK